MAFQAVQVAAAVQLAQGQLERGLRELQDKVILAVTLHKLEVYTAAVVAVAVHQQMVFLPLVVDQLAVLVVLAQLVL
jgi:hypothetical protein